MVHPMPYRQGRSADAIRGRLAEYYTPDEIDRWMAAPHPQLEGQAANEIFSPEGIERIHRIIDRLDADGYI